MKPSPAISAGNAAPFTAADVPVPILQAVVNRTPFKMRYFNRMGLKREFFDVIVLKGSFELQDGKLIPCKAQAEPVWTDTYWDEDQAEISSLKAAADMELIKPSTDVLVTGSVQSPGGKPRKEWSGMLRVVRGKKDVLVQKTLRFTGPRFWKHGFLTGWTLSDPEPASVVPLRYELAYGGWWLNPQEKDPALARQVYAANPSGSGHFGKSHDTGRDYPGPQIELHPQTISAGNRDHTPGGFGPIARFWQPRARHAGTYDDAWFKQFNEAAKADCIPDYPPDFNYRSLQAAPPDQITPTHLRGGEEIGLAGLFDDVAGLVFDLPKLAIDADLFPADGRALRDPMKLDTVHIDLDTRQIHLTWRLTLPQSLGIVHAALNSNPIKEKK